MLAERGHLQDGDHVALVYPPGTEPSILPTSSLRGKGLVITDSPGSSGIDLIAAFYGCLYAGCVPVTVRPPHPQNVATTLPTVKMIVEVNVHVHLDASTEHLTVCCLLWRR